MKTETLTERAARLGVELATSAVTGEPLYDDGFVELMLDELEALPDGERGIAVLAVNDGSSIDDRDAYRPALGMAGYGVRVGETWLSDAHETEAGAVVAALDAQRLLSRLVPGVVVRLTRDVERFPHFIAPAGSIGEVVDIGDRTVFAVRLDEPVAGAEDWSNEVHWSNGDSPVGELELVTRENAPPVGAGTSAARRERDRLENEYRENVRTTFRAMSDTALAYQAGVVVGGIDLEELNAELLRRAEAHDEGETERAYELASSDVVIGLSLDDARFVVESLEYLAGVDEGENTDRDRLIALAERIAAELVKTAIA